MQAKLPLRWAFLLLAAAALARRAAADGATEGPPPRPIRIVQWNVENLFDAEDDPASDGDDEFTPDSWRRWTPELYRVKLDRIASVLHALDGDIVCLQEVENRRVLEELAWLLRERYATAYPHVVHREGSDHRGIDVGMLSRLPPVRRRWLAPVPGQRDILAVRFEPGGHPLLVVVNHWKSRWEGTTKTEPYRARLARAVRELADSARASEPNLPIVIAGDFNDEPNDASIAKVLGAGPAAGGPGLVHLHGLLPPDEHGTFYFRRGQTWRAFDGLIVTPGLLDPQPAGGWRLRPRSYSVVREHGLLDADGRPRPFRRFHNAETGEWEYRQGISDHLPVTAVMEWRGE